MKLSIKKKRQQTNKISGGWEIWKQKEESLFVQKFPQQNSKNEKGKTFKKCKTYTKKIICDPPPRSKGPPGWSTTTAPVTHWARSTSGAMTAMHSSSGVATAILVRAMRKQTRVKQHRGKNKFWHLRPLGNCEKNKRKLQLIFELGTKMGILAW